jgi:hypothetical protein
MIPVGYMAKKIQANTSWLKAPNVVDVYSVACVCSPNFTGDVEYYTYWKHNGYWFFNSPGVIQTVAQENSIDLEGTSLFYYEAHELELAETGWRSFSAEPAFTTNIQQPSQKHLEGFDVVSFEVGTSPDHSPLSCSYLAEEVQTNSHCLFDSFAEAETSLNAGKFNDCDPGPYRIFAVYSIKWPEISDYR